MESQFSKLTSLIGDPVRSKIMWALLDGRAFTATELAIYADTTSQNISMHLQKLVSSDLLSVEKQGRHRYYNYSRADISYAIEALANLIPASGKNIPLKIMDEPIRYCRTCYDHLAGKVGVTITDTLIEQQLILKNGPDFTVSSEGESFFNTLNIDITLLRKQKRSFARACLDWSERKSHLAGSLGSALFDLMIANNWMRRTQNSRAIVVTGKGRKMLLERFKIEV
jgi:DNA-binding transcriptional ArsR family regulator